MTTPMFAFELTSYLTAPRARVWEHASSMLGVNHELAPLLSMTYPPGFSRLAASHISLGQRIFRSWILLGGIVPIEYDELTFVQFQDGHRFVEQSTMLAIQRWQYQRTLTDCAIGCCVTDTIHFQPRLAWTGALLHALFRLVFRHRHQRLRQLFGSMI